LVSDYLQKVNAMPPKRAIFEEVSGQGLKKPEMSPKGADFRPKVITTWARAWLCMIFILVFSMIFVGGLTRLTDSGLSITEWRPVTGALPPLNDQDWMVEFSKYRTSPEYQLQNKGMELEAFKQIYWWEWGHRQLGRVVGMVWALGFLGLWLAGRLPKGWAKHFWFLGALGASQGAIGWWMVSSGLRGAMVDVASYRLATHLGLAFIILGVCTGYILQLSRPAPDLLVARRARETKLFGLSTGLMHFALLQVLLGALVAGIDAGRGFPTWPLMNGKFFPADAFYVPGRPIWAAFFENAGLVQFIHRLSGYGLLAFGMFVWLLARKSPHLVTRRAFHAVILMLLAQMTLGIYTALMAAQVHVALTHQLGAVLLWVLILRGRHLAQYPQTGSIRKGTV
jgi:cytochrome c oxidase assembly protein subunit 15